MSTGISTTTAAFTAKQGLLAAVNTALAGDAEVDILDGIRFPINTERDYVAVLGGRAEADPTTIQPGRGYEETITLDVEIAAWTPRADDEAEGAVQARAFQLYGAIADHIRINDIHLGGTVLWCMPGDVEYDGATGDGSEGWGRLCVVAATFTARHKIRTI